jgi:uroporphyrinogen-III decarboxylase
MTSKELVLKTLNGTNNSGRAPRQLWYLPWAVHRYGDELNKILEDYPADIGGFAFAAKEASPFAKGDPCEVGESTDDWGCTFLNVQRGVVGEVKSPTVIGEEWEDSDKVHIPEEWLTFDVAAVNKAIKEQCADKFTLTGHCPRPFEQLQFIRGTENLYVDLMFRPTRFMDFLEKMHDFYCRLFKKWAQTDVDAFMFMDDWGSQKSLLINPGLWDELFKPLYRDYIDIAHKAGKKIFMHSDGNTLQIIPRLIDLGLDAINSQLFCMGLDNLKQFKGKITFWGEIDRQNLLPHGTTADIDAAVRAVKAALWQNGCCIAQCEFGPGAKPENVRQTFKTWDELA